MRKVLAAVCLLTLLLGGRAVHALDSDMVEPPFLPPPVPASLPRAMSGTGTGVPQATVLFLYTPDAVRLYGSEAAVSARIDSMVSFANTAYVDSGINLQLVRAAAELVYYDNSNTTATAFSHVAYKTHPAFAGVNRRRMATQADFVVLLRPQKSDSAVCGKAFFVGSVANPPTDYWTLGGYAYAHISINCHDFVLAHELGHIMGLAHARDAVAEPSAGKAYAYGAGYKVANDFNTIMASSKGYPPLPACCTYLRVFSSPALSCTGKSGVPKACGIDSTLSNGADAVLAINNIAAQLPLFSDDSDADGMPDWFEHFWGLDRFSPADAGADADGDGRSNIDEFYAESYASAVSGLVTLAQARDTDGDSLLDGQDVFPTISGNPVLELNNLFRGGAISEHVYP